MRRNVFRKLLDEDRPSFGTHVISPWPGTIEIVGRSGVFDYIEYVGEYSPFDLKTLDELGRALDLFPDMSSMMKVEEATRDFIATRAIDSGFQSVLFTDCRTVAEVEECVRIVRAESPEQGGTHGYGMRRNIGYVYGGTEAWTAAMADVVIAIMIEKRQAMENLDAILQVPGVDMVQFGPADYSITVGKSRTDPSVVDDQKRMIEKALEAGVHPRVEVPTVEHSEPFRALGVRHFCVGWDVALLAAWCAEQGRAIAALSDPDEDSFESTVSS